MNAYVSDSLAREHAERLMADAAAARRARSVRRARRAAATTSRAAARSRATARPGAAAAAPSWRRPIAALHAWLVAGEM